MKKFDVNLENESPILRYNLTFLGASENSTLDILEQFLIINHIYYKIYCLDIVCGLILNEKNHNKCFYTTNNFRHHEKYYDGLGERKHGNRFYLNDINCIADFLRQLELFLPTIYFQEDVIASPYNQQCCLKLVNYSHHCPPKLLVDGAFAIADRVFEYPLRKEEHNIKMDIYNEDLNNARSRNMENHINRIISLEAQKHDPYILQQAKPYIEMALRWHKEEMKRISQNLNIEANEEKPLYC